MSERNQFKQTPGRALLAFAFVAVLVAVFTVVEARRRADLEGYDFPTALGDQEWFDFGQNFDPEVEVLQFGGQPLFRQKSKALVRYDKYMFKQGRDDSDQCFLYRYGKPRSGDQSPDGIFYAKIGDGSYIELGEAPRSTPRSVDEDSTELSGANPTAE